MVEEKEFVEKAKIERVIEKLQYDTRFSHRVRKLANELYKAIIEEDKNVPEMQ